MTITGGTKLASEDIDRMIKEAEAHADEDRQRREEADARNQADSVVYQTEKSIKEHGDKLDESDRKMVEDALNDAREALKGSDVEKIKQTSEALMTASQRFAEVLYKNAGDPQAANATHPPGADSATASAGDDDVVDAEVVDEGGQQSA